MNINKTELQKALEIVKPGLANKEIIEQTTSFAFLNNSVVTYNDEISISHPITGLDITGAVSAKELYQLLNKIKKDEIHITIENNEVRLNAGRSKAGITLQNEVKLPLQEIGKISKWKSLPENFIEALKFVIPVCGTDFSRPILTCVHVNEKGFVEASDNNRVASFELDSELAVKTFLIPATSALELVKLPLTKVAEGEGWVHFKTDETTQISCRTFEDEFPDTTPHLKVKGETIILPETIKDMLDKAMVFGKRDHVMDEVVVVGLSGKKIKIRSESEGGWFEEVAKMEKEIAGELTFSIVPYLLKDILNRSHTCILSDSKMKFTGDGWQYMTCLKG